MTITPEQLQVAGVVILVLAGLAFLFWLVRAIVGWQRGRNLLVLPDADPDRDDDEDGDGLDAR